MPADLPPDDAPRIERSCVLAVPDLSERSRALLDSALEQLREVRDPALAPLLRASASDSAITLTHRVPGGAVELSALRSHGPLRLGHVLAVALAACDALAVLHEAGLAHGDVVAERLLVAPDGSVVLAATGAAWHQAPGEPDGPRPGEDVAAVGDLVRDLLGTTSVPAAVVLATLRAADDDVRPDIVGLRAALAAAGRPEPLLDALWLLGRAEQAARPSSVRAMLAAPPVRPVPDVEPGEGLALDPPASTPGRRPRRAPRGRRRIPWVPVAVAVVSALAGLAALATLRGSETALADPPAPVVQVAPPPTTASSPATAPPTATVNADWHRVLASLDERRRAAIAAGSLARLGECVEPTGSAWSQDSALVARVRAAGASITGGGLVIQDVRVRSVGGARVVLEVRDRRTAYDVETAGERTHVPERPARWWAVTLAASPRLEDADAAWRIAAVSPLAATGQEPSRSATIDSTVG